MSIESTFLFGLASHLGVYATRVIAQHAAERAVIMSCGIWPPSQCVGLGCIPKCVADRPRLNASTLLLGIEFDNVVHVFRPIDDHRNVAALTCQTCSTASRQQWGAESSTYRNRLNNILPGLGNDHTNRNLPVIGAVRRIERSAARIETNSAGDHLS